MSSELLGCLFGTGDAIGAMAEHNGIVYVTGLTTSAFGGGTFDTSSNACKTTNTSAGIPFTVKGVGTTNVPVTAFVSAIDTTQTTVNANQVPFSTLLGGSGTADVGGGLAYDSGGNQIFVAGLTYSTDFPTTPNAYQFANNAAAQTSSNAFLTVLDPAGNTCPTPTATPTGSPTPTATATNTRTATATRDGDSNGYCDQDRYSNRDGDQDCDGNSHCHGNRDGNQDRYGDRNADRDRYAGRRSHLGEPEEADLERLSLGDSDGNHHDQQHWHGSTARHRSPAQNPAVHGNGRRGVHAPGRRTDNLVITYSPKAKGKSSDSFKITSDDPTHKKGIKVKINAKSP